jgi:hypothetical protein
MSTHPESRRSLTLRTLLVGLALCWLASPGNAEWCLLLATCAFVGYLVDSREQLPPRLASHFRFDLQADGWMNRRTYLLVFAALGVGIALSLEGVGILARGAQAEFMARHVAWFGCVFVAFLAGVHALIVRANRNEPARLPKLFWGLLAGFQVAIAAWVAAILAHDHWGWFK